MGHVCGKTYYQKMAKPYSFGILVLLLVTALFASTGCSQSVDSVKITRRLIQPVEYISTTDMQGGTSTTPSSANRRLGIHSFGGPNLRTSSASANYQLTGGIGVD